MKRQISKAGQGKADLEPREMARSTEDACCKPEVVGYRQYQSQ